MIQCGFFSYPLHTERVMPRIGAVASTATWGIDMARPKQKAAAKKAAAKPPRTVGVRTTAEWAAWLERGAKHCRTDVAKLIDAAVADYLKASGFDEVPPERIP